jgi:hypothetical protein
MLAIRRKADNIIQHLFDDGSDVTLTTSGLTSPKRVLDVSTETHDVVSVGPLPEPWVYGAYAWDNAWSVADQAAVDARVAKDADVAVEALSNAKLTRISDAKATRDRIELEASFTWACPVDGVTYTLDGDERSIARMLKVRDLLAEMEMQGTPTTDAKQPWRTADDTYTPPLGTDDIQNMVYTKGLQGAAAWEAFRAHEQAIMALTTVDEVVAYDTSTGWPD